MDYRNISCPKCNGKNVKIVVNAQLSMPAEYYRNLKKSMMSKRGFKLLHVFWDNALFTCEDCCHVWKLILF